MDVEKFLTYFEEIRFVLELLVANHMFSRLFSAKSENYRFKVVLSTVCMCILSCVYPTLIMKAFVGRGESVVIELVLANVGWYIFLTLLSGLIIQACYKQSMADSVFICALGYALQHLEFVLINEWLAKGTWVELPNMVPLYITICIGTTMIQYSLVYKVFHHYFEGYKGTLFEDNRQNFIVIIGMLILLVLCSFICQNIFCSGQANYDNINLQGALVDVIDCIMVLTVGFFMSRISSLNKEKDIVEQLLYERKRQYELSRENIEVINSKCHDLKHQIKALETVDATERHAYIHELGKAINIYDSVLNTGNEVVDIGMSLSCIYCF